MVCDTTAAEELSQALAQAKQDHQTGMADQQQRFDGLIAELKREHGAAMAEQAQRAQQELEQQLAIAEQQLQQMRLQAVALQGECEAAAESARRAAEAEHAMLEAHERQLQQLQVGDGALGGGSGLAHSFGCCTQLLNPAIAPRCCECTVYTFDEAVQGWHATAPARVHRHATRHT